MTTIEAPVRASGRAGPSVQEPNVPPFNSAT